MDNLTHSLVGLFLARAGFRRATARGTAILMLAANAPDLDVVTWLGGSASYIHWHRNITHALVGLPMMALITVALVRLVGRKPLQWWPALGIAALGVASHLLLDLTNVYGVRLLLPFSGHWFHWDVAPVVDVGIWAILVLGAIAPAFGRLVGSEIGEKKRAAGGGWAIFALVLLTVYDYGRSVLHDRAVNLMDSRVYGGLSARRTAAFPQANPLQWAGLAELSNAYVMVPIDLRQTFRPESGETYYKAERTPEMMTAMATAPFQTFLEFVVYPIWVLEPSAGLLTAWRVTLLDLRFGTPQQPGFQAVATVKDGREVVTSEFTFGQVRPR